MPEKRRAWQGCTNWMARGGGQTRDFKAHGITLNAVLCGFFVCKKL